MGKYAILTLVVLVFWLLASCQPVHAGMTNIPTPTPTTVINVVSTTPNPQVKELPKTGLPIVGLLLMGLVPVGYKLRKYYPNLFDDSENPKTIWQNRQLKK